MSTYICRECNRGFIHMEDYDNHIVTHDACSPRDPLLVEREKTHGSFANNARMWDRFCKSINNDNQMKPEQRLAMSMIFLKIARMHEQPNVKDHWDDIAGYAKLGAEACE